jgi:hypothetical protein
MPYKIRDFGGRFANRDRRQSPNKTSSAGRLGGSGGTRWIQNGNLQRSQHPNPRSTITNPFRNTSLYNDDAGSDGWYPGDGGDDPGDDPHHSTYANSDEIDPDLLTGLPQAAQDYLMGEHGVDSLTLSHFVELGFLNPTQRHTLPSEAVTDSSCKTTPPNHSMVFQMDPRTSYYCQQMCRSRN